MSSIGSVAAKLQSKLARVPNLRAIVIAIVLFAAAAAAIYFLAPPGVGVDWWLTWRPAALFLLRTGNPYHEPTFVHAPWTVLPLIPLALLPERLGYALFTAAGLFMYALAAYRFRMRPIAFAAFLLSPPVVHGVFNANLDWAPLLGFLLPPQIGLFLIAVKPQMGSAVAVFWLVETWREGGWKQTLRVFAPATAAILASFALYGFWPLRFDVALAEWWNASLWPFSIPVGLVLLAASLRQRRLEFAMAASPCLAPYLLLHSWVGALATLAASDLYMVLAVIGLWVAALI